MTSLRLILLPRFPGAPVLERLFENGRVIRSGVFVGADADLPTVAVAPGEDAVCRWLALPGGREPQAAAAAGFLLEDQIAAPREALHIAVGASEADGQRLAVVVDRARMQAWIDLVATFDVQVSAIIPDHLLLPEPEPGEVVYAAIGDGVAAVRGRRLALSCEDGLIPVVADGGRRLEPEEADALMAAGAAAPLLDLRQGMFAPSSERSEGRRTNSLAVLAALALLSVIAVPAVEAGRHHLAASDAYARAEDLAGPGEGEPAARLRAKLDRLQAAERFPVAAAALFAAVESIEGMELQGLLYGGDGALRVSVAHSNYSDTEQFRTRLAGDGLGVEESSTVTEGGRIISDLVVRPQR